MFKNMMFLLVPLLFIACGSSKVNDILGIDENEIRVDSSNMNTSFEITLDINLISTDLTKLGLTDVVNVSYILEDDEGSELLEYKAHLKSEVNTECTRTLTESNGDTFSCKTKYSNDLARTNVDEDLTQTIKLLTNKTYKIILKEYHAKIDEVKIDDSEKLITTLELR
ncbi:hypothetical protein KO488_13440 [Poseidonibacter lekithochrous]|uniref:hypothetical protein n=1 Tax=Poseidonibacter TaxID=2321187 RepID=UPI001C0976B4|nr:MULTISPECIES: hypothetical protein [Poseidonibacter]MBU3015768.1 hypothetical protein [Poseidonibacter lekithochrous]MDO6829068.1 hypothetical protein [Poseidonibacter sp. 1_MG-2023]